MGRIMEVSDAAAGKQTVYQKYALAADDAGKLGLLAQAQILVLGASRSGKSQVCFSLADKRVFAANVPVTYTKGELDPLGPTCERLIQNRTAFVVGIYCDPKVLLERRLATRRGRNGMGDLASIVHECQLTQQFYNQNGIWSVDSSKHTTAELAEDIFSRYRMIHGARSHGRRARPDQKRPQIMAYADDRAI